MPEESNTTLHHLFVGAAAAAALLGIVSPAEARGFTYSGGTYTIINPPGATFAALSSINDAGAVAGDCCSIPGFPEPATWMMTLLGFLGLGGVMRHSKRQLTVAA